MRTVPPTLYDEAAKGFDQRIKTCFDFILGTTLRPNAWLQAQLSPSFSGFGLRSVALNAPGAYLASIHNNQHILEVTPAHLTNHLTSAEDRMHKLNGYQTNHNWKQKDYSNVLDECSLAKKN